MPVSGAAAFPSMVTVAEDSDNSLTPVVHLWLHRDSDDTGNDRATLGHDILHIMI